MFDKSQTYYTMVDNSLRSNGYVFHNGLNIFTDNFIDDEAFIGTNGFYFTDVAHILEIADNGIIILEVTIPDDAIVVAMGNKYRTNKMITKVFGKITKPETLQAIHSLGAVISDKCWTLLCIYTQYGLLENLQYMYTNGISIDDRNEIIMRLSSIYGKPTVAQYIDENTILSEAEKMLCLSAGATNGFLEVVKYFDGIGIKNDRALIASAIRGRLEILEYFYEVGYDFSSLNVFSLISLISFAKIREFLKDIGLSLFKF